MGCAAAFHEYVPLLLHIWAHRLLMLPVGRPASAASALGGHRFTRDDMLPLPRGDFALWLLCFAGESPSHWLYFLTPSGIVYRFCPLQKKMDTVSCNTAFVAFVAFVARARLDST